MYIVSPLPVAGLPRRRVMGAGRPESYYPKGIDVPRGYFLSTEPTT